jgi:hypothetical protein
MFSLAEIMCGVSGFSIVLGMLLIVSFLSLEIILSGIIFTLIGLAGICLSTKLHELDKPFYTP